MTQLSAWAQRKLAGRKYAGAAGGNLVEVEVPVRYPSGKVGTAVRWKSPADAQAMAAEGKGKIIRAMPGPGARFAADEPVEYRPETAKERAGYQVQRARAMHKQAKASGSAQRVADAKHRLDLDLAHHKELSSKV